MSDLKPTKAVVAAVGTTLTALTTVWAVVSVAYESNGVDVGEYGTILTAVLTAVATVRGVWAVTNRPRQSVTSLPARDLREDYRG